MNRHTRWFRRLLKLLPSDFQADYARDMERTFAAQHRATAREEGSRGVARLWLETLGDFCRTAPRQHVEQIAQDVRYAVRTMAGRPGFTAIAALVFALGIGATTAVFSIVDASLLRPVPFDNAGRLVAVRELVPRDPQPWELSYPAFIRLREESRSFEHVAAHMRNGVVVRSLSRTSGVDPRLTDAALISSNLLTTLRVTPAAGRNFRADEDAPGAPSVMLVSERLARERFTSPEDAVGETLVIDNAPATIVGVLPATFRFPGSDVDVYMPIGRLANEPWMQNREVHVALVVARLRDGVSLESARRELDDWLRAWQARERGVDVGHAIFVRSLTDQVSADARPAIVALASAVGLLLVVTCTSVGLLLLTRAAGRSGEVALRLALGASRARIVRQMITETLCLAIAGAALGVLGARIVLRFLIAGLDDALPPLVLPTIGTEALAWCVLLTTFVAVICGTLPAAQALHLPRTVATPAPRRWRQALVAAQVAVACTLVVVAALLGRSLAQLLSVDTGFRDDRLIVMRVTTPGGDYEKPGAQQRFYHTAVSRLRALPGVTAVTATSRPPLRPGSQGQLTIEGRPADPTATVLYRRVWPGFFATLGVRVVEGREFADRDDGRERVAIVSASLARRFFPPGRAIGQRIKVGPPEREPWARIVGVVGDVRNAALDGGPDLSTYEPYVQRPWNGMFLMVRTANDPQLTSTAAEKALREVEPDVLVSEISTMDGLIAESVAARRFHATLVGGFAGATLVLVALAVYGVVAFQVTARTREIGIRAAVGASSAQVLRYVMVDGLRPVVAGVAVGLAGAGAAATSLRALLFRVSPADVSVYVASVTTLFLVAVLATWLPARRAARIDPSAALRSE